MNWQRAVEDTVTGLGYDLVDAEKSAGGLLRVLIDNLPPSAVSITVDDCEKVTRQLQHVLEVEGASYERLEVSSPGLDRPLKKAADYARFAGEQVELTLKVPFKGRKKYIGELQAHGEGWRLVLVSEKLSQTRATKRDSAQRAAQLATRRAAQSTAQSTAQEGAEEAAHAQAEPNSDLALDFSLDEVREARLVPVVDFKGRRFAAPEAESPTGTGPHIEVEGGRIQ